MMDKRLDKTFDELMRDAAETYRRPPEAPLAEMWASIESELRNQAGGPVLAQAPVRTPRVGFRTQNWMAIAATLLVGIGIGRATSMFNRAPEPSKTVATVPAALSPVTRVAAAPNAPYEAETSRYLGQTAALLIALPSEMKGGKTDEQFIARAGDLLTTTRMLIDSPASRDPSMRNLLEDLELVLAQVVRLQNNTNRTELDLINRALEQRDVIPRLRKAVVADNSAN